jgi:hypothetical protein
MYPKPKPGDPKNFPDLLRRHLVPEVRNETACFYEGLDSLEAQYPGLDYSHPPHRMRLSWYTWHGRLFRAFDTLRLTRLEIASLTTWEGTRWAREKYEKEHSIKIRDTTGDCIHEWVDPMAQEEKIEPVEGGWDVEDMDDGYESDICVGVELNDQAAREVELNEQAGREAEQWLKDVAEASEIPNHIFLLPNNNVSGHVSTTSMPPRHLDATSVV